MVIPTAVIPQSIVLIKNKYVLLFHEADYRVDTVSQSQSFASRHKAGDGRACFFQEVGFKFSIPPRSCMTTSYKQYTVHLNTSVDDTYFRLCPLFVWNSLFLFNIIDWFDSCWHDWRDKFIFFDPILQCQTRIISFFCQCHSYFYGRATCCTCVSRQDTCSFCAFFLQAFR